MKVLLTYSSKTGNTKQVAEAIAKALPGSLEPVPITNAPDYREYDLVIVGFWIDKGKPNAEALRYIRTVKSKQVAFFFTLGADVDSNHAKQCRNRSGKYFDGNVLLGDFCCQGKISPKMIRILRHLPSWFPHGPNPERLVRWERASTHPDANDLKCAAEYFSKLCVEMPQY